MKIAIIGAGLAGVTLARQLDGLAEITLLEKSRGVGGRMANRRREGFAFDHGAQYFTARGETFRAALETANVVGAVAPWPTEIRTLPDTGHLPRERGPEARLVGMPGMNGLAAAFGRGLDIRLETQVASIRMAEDRWLLSDSHGTALGRFDFVISTAPAPQTARLMPDVFVRHPDLQSVRMNGCFTLMIGCRQTPDTDFVAMRANHAVLSWVAVDSSKPGRGGAFSLVAHSRNDWADAHIEADPAMVRHAMLDAIAALAGHDFSHADWIDLHRWRYANVEHPAGHPFLLDTGNRLAACGDWCIGNRVEAAFESARQLGQAMRSMIAGA